MQIQELTSQDKQFLAYLRSFSIFIIVFGHVGGFWMFKPYSEYLHVFVAVFFFISGAVNFPSYQHSKSTKTYLMKRFTGILVPYYLLCVLALIIYCIQNHQLPQFNLTNLMLWLQIRPIDSIVPFPIGQVWFLHTLFFIIFFSPIYFTIYIRNMFYILYVVIIIFLIMSSIQLAYDIDNYFLFFGNNLFKPFIHSLFFIYGFIYFSSQPKYKKKILVSCTGVAFITTILTHFLVKQIGYSHHTFAPDLHYITGCIVVINALIWQSKLITYVISINFIFKKIFLFFYKHTFSIFLLHSLAIYLTETLLGMKHPESHFTRYAIVKLTTVLLLTCLMAVPFTQVSISITKKLMEMLIAKDKSTAKY